MDKELLRELVFKAIDAINIQLSANEKIPKEITTILYGEGSQLDSLTLVNLIVEIEQQFQDGLGRNLALTDESTLFQEDSPIKTINSLIAFISNLIEKGS